jgi:hypothetical protein
MWKYLDYKQRPDGEFVNSHFLDISNRVTTTIPPRPDSLPTPARVPGP